jgi:hypothetical protein
MSIYTAHAACSKAHQSSHLSPAPKSRVPQQQVEAQPDEDALPSSPFFSRLRLYLRRRRFRYPWSKIYDFRTSSIWTRILRSDLKPTKDITLAECNDALKQVPDHEIFPELPEESKLTISKRPRSNYVKRPKLSIYELVEGTPFLAAMLLHEADEA